MTKIFISYSRKDKAFAEKLNAALEEIGLDPWIDWIDIPPTADWRDQIQKGIESADAFLFLLSPDSVISKICSQEIDHAVKNGKRLIPLVARDVTAQDVHSALTKLNWIFFREQDNFESSLKKLQTGIETDLVWVESHSRLQVRAIEWEKRKDRSLLLRGKDLREAEEQLANAGEKDPQPTDLQRQYVLESRRSESQTRNTVLAVSGVTVVILAFISVFAFNQRNRANSNALTAVTNQHAAETAQVDALHQKETAIANEAEAIRQAKISRAGELAAQSSQMRNQDFKISLLLGIEAFRSTDTVRSRANLLENINTSSELIRFFGGHTAQVNAVAFSPDDHILAAAGSDGMILLWDVATGQQIGEPLRGHTIDIKRVAFSPDGKILASSDDDNILLWDVTTYQLIGEPLVGHTSSVSSIAFSPVENSHLLASGSYDGKVIFWDTATGRSIGQPVEANNLYTRPVAVAFSPDGTILASGSFDPEIVLWDVTTHTAIGEPLQGHLFDVNSLAFSTNGKILASGSLDETIILWDVATGQPIGEPLKGHTGNVLSVTFSPDGKTLASGSADETIRFWDASTGKPTGKVLAGYTGSVLSLDFSSDGNFLASGTLYSSDPLQFGDYKGDAILWKIPLTEDISTVPATFPDIPALEDTSVTTATSIGQPVLDGSPIDAFTVSPDGKTIAVSFTNGTLELWDVDARQAIGEPFHAFTFVNMLAFSPDGKLLAIAGENTILLLNSSTRQPVGKPLSVLGAGNYFRIAFSPDSSMLAADNGPQGSLILWDVTTQQAIGEPILDPTDAFTSFSFTQDGKFLAIALRKDGSTVLWDLSKQTFVSPPIQSSERGSTEYSGAFSPDAKILASNGDDTSIRLWDLTKQQFMGQPLTGHSGSVMHFVFSSSSKLLATSDDNGTLILWDVYSQEQIGRILFESPAYISGIAFTPDEKKLFVSDDRGNLTSWDVDPLTWIEKTCQRVGTNFTLTDWQRYFQGEEYRKTCEELPKDESYYRGIAENALAQAKDTAHMQKALDLLRREMQSDSSIEDPNIESSQIILEFALQEIGFATYELRWSDAFDLLTWIKQQKLPLYTLPHARSLNSICWNGSLHGYAKQVMEYCEAAVELAPFDAGILDSRGLARALTEDYAGAIDDFQYFVVHSDDANAVEQRKAWIEQLTNGTNPFTTAILEGLANR